MEALYQNCLKQHLISFNYCHVAGITPRVIRHLFQIVENIKKKQKPGEKIEVSRPPKQ